MCIGESTTAGGYPWELEEALLNKSAGRASFTVINKGINGTNSGTILAQLKVNLDRYRPDLVLVMMGINDGHKTLVYEENLVFKIKLLLQGFRVYKLAGLLEEHIAHAISEIKKGEGGKFLNRITNLMGGRKKDNRSGPAGEIFSPAGNDISRADWYFDRDEFGEALPLYEEVIALNPDDLESMIKLANCYVEVGRYMEAEEILKEAAEIKPDDSRIYSAWGNLFHSQNKMMEAVNLYKKALGFNPPDIRAAMTLERIYLDRGEWGKAETIANRKEFKEYPELSRRRYERYMRLAKKHYYLGNYGIVEQLCKIAIKIRPRDDRAYTKLGHIFFVSPYGESKAETNFKKALEINPRNASAHAYLGAIHEARGELSRAEKCYREAIKLNPTENLAFSRLVSYYLSSKKYSAIHELCQTGMKSKPENDRIWGAMAICYTEQGKEDLAVECFNKADELRKKYYNPQTVKNYQKLIKILGERGIKLVCIQYPMRKLEDLKNMIPNHEGIIFVDNEAIFKEAVEREGMNEYFIDNFAGDFGHCTKKGNRLMAENVADVILIKIFPAKKF